MAILITLSPIRMDAAPPVVSVEGDTLTIDGNAIDLAAYDADAPHPMIAGQPELVEDTWQITILLPHGPDAAEDVRFPAPVGIEEGTVELPADPEPPGFGW